MDFEKINEICRQDGFLPTKKLSELVEGEKFKVTGLKQVLTRFGRSIVISLNDEFNIFLPRRIVAELNKNTELLFNQMEEAVNKDQLFFKYLSGTYKNRCEFSSD